ncbi:MAG: hypothetical protein KAT86_00035, partial [Candidatus Latescibacteria bacterium]|nr:hypothetical protein [Candidatus Latescibacterota bacterium]
MHTGSGETIKLEIAYLYDASYKERCNARGENFWFEYLKEIFCQLGISAKAVTPEASGIEEKLRELKVLFMGTQHVLDYGIEGAAKDIENWVAEGGLLIGFGVKGLDELFGIEPFSHIAQSPNDYTLSGYFEFTPHPLTQDIHSSLSPKQKLLIFSDIQQVKPKGGIELAHLYDREEKDA